MPTVYLKFRGSDFSCLMHILQYVYGRGIAAKCLHILQYVYGRRMERESGLFSRLTPIQTLLTDSFPGNGNLPQFHPRLRTLLLLHRGKSSGFNKSHSLSPSAA